MKILVIEDDASVRQFIANILKKAEHTVLEAENGLSVISILKENIDMDLIVTDIIMPEKEGLETIMDIRNKYPEIKIIAISGGGKIDSEQYLLLAATLGANKTLKKPFKGSDLLNTIADL